MNTGNEIEHLLLRQLQGLSTDDEARRIAEWAAESPENRTVLGRLENSTLLQEDLGALFQLTDHFEKEGRFEQMKINIEHLVSQKSKPHVLFSSKFYWKPLLAAAAVFFIVAVGVYFFQSQTVVVSPQLAHTKTDVEPGGNRATLTLVDGRNINLKESEKGIKFGDEISYLDGSLLNDETLGHLAKDEVVQLQLTTPRGGTYQLTLSDGTTVWLNASSKLKYPSRFNGKERIVELEGEAFFDVTAQNQGKHFRKIPFKVLINGQTIEVLGTQFNVSAYADESTVKTTLVEGSVRLHKTNVNRIHSTDVNSSLQKDAVVLFPGEQAVLLNDQLSKHSVDIETYIAWKNGYFYFYRTTLKEIMSQIARWYDVEVVYPNGIPNETFSGKVSRKVSLLGLLEILHSSSIDTSLEGKRLIVK